MNLLWSAPLFLFIVLSGPLKAQCKLLYRSRDVLQVIDGEAAADSLNPIVLIKPRPEFSKYLTVRYAHLERKLIPKKQVWGFTYSTHAIWRCYHNDLCRVMSDNGVWIEYSIYRTESNRTGNLISWCEPGHSRSLDSKVWSSWLAAMADVPTGFGAGRRSR